MESAEKTPCTIAIAETDEQIAQCFRVLKQLRPSLSEQTFVATIRRMEKESFRLAYVADPIVRAVAGYRLMETLATGKTLYVDDLVTDEESRSSGYGARLFAFLVEEAKKAGCAYFELDSGLKRLDAHRFYRRQGLAEIAFHFSMPLFGAPKWSEADMG